MKTIRQIADELGVSKTAVRKKIEKLGLWKDLQKSGNRIAINSTQEKLIKQAFLKAESKSVSELQPKSKTKIENRFAKETENKSGSGLQPKSETRRNRKPIVEVRRNNELIETIVIDKEKFWFGRADEADYVLKERFISRKQFEVHVKGDMVCFQNFSHSNGTTIVNVDKDGEDCVIKNELIYIWKSEMVLQIGEITFSLAGFDSTVELRGG